MDGETGAVTEIQANGQGELEQMVRAQKHNPNTWETNSTTVPLSLRGSGLLRPEFSLIHMSGIPQPEPASRCELGEETKAKACF